MLFFCCLTEVTRLSVFAVIDKSTNRMGKKCASLRVFASKYKFNCNEPNWWNKFPIIFIEQAAQWFCNVTRDPWKRFNWSGWAHFCWVGNYLAFQSKSQSIFHKFIYSFRIADIKTVSCAACFDDFLQISP